jgi:sugar transferase (PEP-CTERM/EpsH1 system associated)
VLSGTGPKPAHCWREFCGGRADCSIRATGSTDFQQYNQLPRTVRVLFLTHRLPYAPNRGDRARAFHIVRTLAGRVDLDLVSLVHDRNELANAESLRHLGVRVAAFPVKWLTSYAKAILQLPTNRPLTHVLLDAPGLRSSLTEIVRQRRPDVVLAYCSSMARFALEPPLWSFPLVLDLVDVDSEKWTAMAATASGPKRWLYQRESRYLARFEREAATRAYVTLVVNERESKLLKQIAPDAPICILPAGVDLAELQPRTAPAESSLVIFCGVMNYHPNIQGVLWFAREVWPLIRARRPDALFRVVGSDPTATIRRLTSERAGIEVTGTVADVRSHLWNGAVSVAPLMTARGVQNKVLEAIAAGLPAVVTSEVTGGLPPELNAACRVADSPESFARETLSLLALSGRERRAVAAQADLRALSWDARLAPLHEILAAAASQRRARNVG